MQRGCVKRPPTLSKSKFNTGDSAARPRPGAAGSGSLYLPQRQRKHSPLKLRIVLVPPLSAASRTAGPSVQTKSQNQVLTFQPSSKSAGSFSVILLFFLLAGGNRVCGLVHFKGNKTGGEASSGSVHRAEMPAAASNLGEERATRTS